MAGMNAMRIIEERQALGGRSACVLMGQAWEDGGDLQETKSKRDIHSNLLLRGQWKTVDKFDRKAISDQVSCDVKSGISQVEVVDVDALLLSHAQVPSCFDRATLEGAGEDVAHTLARNNSNHDQRRSSKTWISETAVHDENREFDEAEAGVVKDRRQPDNLLQFSEISRASRAV